MDTENTKAKVNVVADTITAYDRELSETEETTVGSVVKLLNKHQVKDELQRARILAKSKAFIRDTFNAAVTNDIL
jgi:hypothetical protein